MITSDNREKAISSSQRKTDSQQELVVKLHQENKTIRQIAEIVHMSFKDIGAIINRIDGQPDDDGIDLSKKSKTTQAIYLFKSGKKPIEVAIELDISANQEWSWSIPKIFRVMKKNKLINQKDIQTVLRYAAFDLPSLESKIRKLTSDVIDLGLRKKDLDNTIRLQRAQLSDLGQVITKYQDAIDSKQRQ